MKNLNKKENEELKRLLFVAIMQEADRMNLQGIENAVYFLKKMNEPDHIGEATEMVKDDKPKK